MWGYGLISSATGADAMALALRFLPLTFAFCGIAYHEEHELGVLGFGEPALADGLRQFLLERDMAAAAVLLREIGGGDFRVRAFTLTARALARGNSRRDLPTVFGATPTYGAARNSLLFDRAWLARPLPQANPVTVAMCEQMCGRLLEERRARLGTAALVRHYLDSAPGGQPPTLDGMAQRMHTSPRTLKRRLQEDGSSFRALLAEHRSALARQWLQEGNLSLTEIAARLGFSDLSTFSQAFKRWHGVAPALTAACARAPERRPSSLSASGGAPGAAPCRLRRFRLRCRPEYPALHPERSSPHQPGSPCPLPQDRLRLRYRLPGARSAWPRCSRRWRAWMARSMPASPCIPSN